MEGHGRHGQARLRPEPADLHQIDKAPHVLLDLFKAAQAVQLGHELLQRLLRLLLRFRRLRLGLLARRGGLGLVRGLAGAHRRAVRPAGDEVPHVQRGLAAGHPRLVAEGGHGVGAGIDEGGLVLADQPVGGGKEQHHQGEGVHEPAAQALALLHVRLHQPPEEIGQHEAGVVRHQRGQLPVQAGGHRVALAVNGVIVFHVIGGQALILLPHAAGALPHEGVRLPAEGHPGGGVGDLAAEGGHALVILLVGGAGAEGLFHETHLLNDSFLPDIIWQADPLVNKN